jgi:succinate dehydrogenase/fumarate reductase-like Fe-S protein
MQAYRWVVDSRDQATDERLAMFTDDYKLKKCYTIGACTVTCPKGLNPRDALEALKVKVKDYEDRRDNMEV